MLSFKVFDTFSVNTFKALNTSVLITFKVFNTVLVKIYTSILYSSTLKHSLLGFKYRPPGSKAGRVSI